MILLQLMCAPLFQNHSPGLRMKWAGAHGCFLRSPLRGTQKFSLRAAVWAAPSTPAHRARLWEEYFASYICPQISHSPGRLGPFLSSLHVWHAAMLPSLCSWSAVSKCLSPVRMWDLWGQGLCLSHLWFPSVKGIVLHRVQNYCYHSLYFLFLTSRLILILIYLLSQDIGRGKEKSKLLVQEDSEWRTKSKLVSSPCPNPNS